MNENTAGTTDEPTHDIDRYLDVRSAYTPSFGPHGERLSFLLDVTGTRQVWTLDGLERWPQQATFGDERVSFVTWSPERNEFAFGMDAGGDEQIQLYKRNEAAGTVTCLTDVHDAAHWWGGWNSDGSQFAFVANRRNPGQFDVYVQDADRAGPAAATLVHESDGWVDVLGWGPDDERLLLSRSGSTFDDDLFVLDLASGNRRHLTPHEGDVRYRSANWGPDGESLYLVTDEGADTLYLARLDLDSLDVTPVVRGGDWNVEGVGLDAETGHLAYARNVDGYTEVTTAELVAETEIRTFPEPNLPDGVVGEMRFGPDSERFVVTVSTGSQPSNLYVVEVATGDAERWTAPSTAGIPAERFVGPDLVRYESFDGLTIPAFFSVPEDATPGETPVVVDVHGGPESQRRPSFRAKNQYFLDHGYAVFEPNIRGSTGYGTEYSHLDDGRKRMDAIADIEAGVEWLRAHRLADPGRLVAMGTSYGGFAVLSSLVEYPDSWAGGVSIAGIADFTTFLENTSAWRRELREREYGSLDEDREFLREISPLHAIGSAEAPLLVIHGENDARVPVEEARALADRAAETDTRVRTLIFEDEGHGIDDLGNQKEAYRAIVDFVEEVT